MEQKSKENEFKKAYSGLNREQKKAVDAIEGPVLVLAGPGTGKTQILAARIAHILETTDVLPENILCLTYTDAGSIQMRKRLMQFIGTNAYRIPVFTFHAFCNKVIQENSDYFGMKALDAISELEQKLFVRKIIDGFPKNHPLKRYSGEVYYEVEKLLRLYEAMKREDWKEDWLNAKIETYLLSLEDKEEYKYKRDSKYGKKGEWKKSYFEEVKRMEQLKAAVATFSEYQDLLKQHSRYDFADMILWIIEAFKNNPALLSNYQEQFQYFLVDEYQDTSGSQNELLTLLLDYWDVPNVFCVGDDDQSIFRFQGANVENIFAFINRYQPLKISLTDNYRSSQYILDAAAVCIRNNQTRIDQNKLLVAANATLSDLEIKPQIRSYPNPMHEVVDIASEIQELLNCGIPGNEIAVLYRKHQQAESIIKYLRAKNIAVQTRYSVNILEEPLVKKLLQVLRYISAENKKAHSGESFLFELLHFDFFGIPPIEIAAISVDVYRSNFKERVTSWREKLASKRKGEQEDLFASAQQTKVYEQAGKLLETWISLGFNATIQQLIEHVITESGMLVQALTSYEKTKELQVLHTFFAFVKEECSRNPKLTLSGLLNTIELMEEEGVRIPMQQIIVAENGVQFMSTHGAKGMEFAYVFLIGCNTSKWEKSRGNNRSYKLPENLFEISNPDSIEESRRLFYVALTRAKHFLSVSYVHADDAGKEQEKSQFVAELEIAEQVNIMHKQVETEKLIAYDLEVMGKEKLPEKVDLFDNKLVDDLLQDYSLSVTHLNKYLKCQTAFYFESLIRFPAPLSGNMTFGSAVHYALEQLFKKMNLNPSKEFGSMEELVSDFKWYMRRNEEAFTPAEYKRRMEYGEMILPAYYEHYLPAWNKVTSIERSYRNVVVEGVPLNGKLDKLEFDGNVVNVVDYKTGNYQNAIKKFKTPDTDKTELAIADGKKPKFEDEFGETIGVKLYFIKF